MKIINKSVCHGIAGKRKIGYKPKGIVIHNDDGSMTPSQYVNWLAAKSNKQLEDGFAHYYGNRNEMARVEDTYNAAWHTANTEGNQNYVGYEVCESLKVSDKDFLANEQAVFKQAADDMKEWGLTPNRNTVRLHREFSATSCPHRSWEIHGKSVNAVKDYFISQIKKYMTGGSNSNSSGNTSSAPGKNTKPLTNGKVGDTVKIFDALYKDSDGKGRSTKMRGKTGVIKKIANGKGKKYLVETWGWAHPNDLQLVKSGATNTGYPAKKVGQTVTVQSWATTYQTGQKIASFVRGKSYKIKQVKSVNQSKSKRAYLLDGINSWVLEQDVK